VIVTLFESVAAACCVLFLCRHWALDVAIADGRNVWRAGDHVAPDHDSRVGSIDVGDPVHADVAPAPHTRLTNVTDRASFSNSSSVSVNAGLPGSQLAMKGSGTFLGATMSSLLMKHFSA
jgi:hypothetical protein